MENCCQLHCPKTAVLSAMIALALSMLEKRLWPLRRILMCTFGRPTGKFTRRFSFAEVSKRYRQHDGLREYDVEESCLSLSADNRWLAILRKNEVTVWDLTKGQREEFLPGSMKLCEAYAHSKLPQMGNRSWCGIWDPTRFKFWLVNTVGSFLREVLMVRILICNCHRMENGLSVCRINP